MNVVDAFSGKDEDVVVLVFAGSVDSLSRCKFHGARWREMVLQNRGRREDDGAAMKLVLALHSRGDGDDDGAAMEMKVEDGCCY